MALFEPPHEHMRKHKRVDQLRSNLKLISAFVFATRIVKLPYFLNIKFPDPSDMAKWSQILLFSNNNSVFVGPVRKPHCWFSHDAVHFRNT